MAVYNTWNIRNNGLSGLGLGGYNMGNFGIGCGNLFSDMNLGGFMDYDAMMGWNTVNSIFTMGTCILGTAIKSNKESKAINKKEYDTASGNVSSLKSEITTLTEQNKNLDSYSGNIDSNIVALTKLFSTEGSAYTTAKNTNDSFKESAENTPSYKKRIDVQQVIIDSATSTEQEKTAAKTKIAEIKSEFQDEKVKAETAFKKAKEKLESTIKAKIDENNVELAKKEKDLEEAEKKLEELKSPSKQKSVDEQLNTDDGNILNRTSKKNVESRFDENGNLKNGYDKEKAEKDFRGALSQYRDARANNNTEKMKLWGERALKLYEVMNDDQKAEHSISKQYLDQDRSSDGNWTKKAKPNLGL